MKQLKSLTAIILLFTITANAQPKLKKAKVSQVVKSKKTATPVPPVQTTPPPTPHDSTLTIVSADTVGKAVAFKIYNNYDFVPGDKIIFEDNFSTDQQGEFPAHWNLGSGQAVVNNMNGANAFFLTEGNYAHVSPLFKSATYLKDTFTVEFDMYVTNYGPHIYFYNSNTDATHGSNDKAQVNFQDLSAAHVLVKDNDIDLMGKYPDEMMGEKFLNKWHHVAIGYKNNLLKVYLDQYRILVVPNLGVNPRAFDIEGLAAVNEPIGIANVRIANGGGMNMLGKKFTDTKIITHGINFDFLKATIKPESMGTLNMIVQVMKDNPDVKFEVGGHTSKNGQGDPAANMQLSQQRSLAVMNQLISMGIEAARLKAKGYGETKPIADNVSLEGQAQNRRVEFVKF